VTAITPTFGAGGLTRGGLLKAGAAGALALSAGGAVAALGVVSAGVTSQGNDEDGHTVAPATGGAAYLQHQTYLPLIGSTFHLTAQQPSAPGEAVAPAAPTKLQFRLASAEGTDRGSSSFSLIFRAPRTIVVKPGGQLYRLEHPQLGQFELFMNPVDRGVTHLNLQAVINRIAT
jgi:hypothetical protein